MKKYIKSSTDFEQEEFEEMVRPVVDALDEINDIQRDRCNCSITYNFGVDENGSITAGVDIHLYGEEDNSQVDAVKGQVEEVFDKYGYKLDPRFKVNPGKTYFGDVHYQIIKE